MNLSFSEIVIILIVALVVIGPKKLPDVAKSIGKGYSEFRRAFNDLKKSVDVSADIPVSGSSQSSNKDTYKSRWEEQITPPAITAEPIVTDTGTASPEAETVKESPQAGARSRKSDLIKEEEDGRNG